MNSLIFRAAHDRKVGHVVFFSCSVMLREQRAGAHGSDFDANAEIAPRYFGIGWTKVYIEKMCEFYARLGTTRYTAIRHSNIYGPHDKFDLERSHVFGATVTKAMTAADGRIVVWGSGEEARDLLLCRRSRRVCRRRRRSPARLRSRSTIAALVRRHGQRTRAHDRCSVRTRSAYRTRPDQAYDRRTRSRSIAAKRRTSLAGGRRSPWTKVYAAPSRGGATIWPLCRLVMLRKTRRSALTSRSSRHTTVISSVS